VSKQDEFKRRFRHIPEIVMNKGELDIVDLEIAEDYVENIPMPPQFPPNRQGFKDFVLMLRTAFPDLHYEVDHLTKNDLIGENQKVVHRIVAHATHDGPWGPIPATHKKMTWTEIHIGLYVEGKLVEHWGNINTLAIMQQMGVIPGWYEKPAVPARPDVKSKDVTDYKENAAIVRRFIHDVWNKGVMDVADILIHPRSIDPSYPEFPVGPEGAKLAVTMFRHAFPDLYMFIEDVVAEEDMVAIRFVMAGTHEGIFMDIPPTGRTVEVGGCSIFHFGDGQIIERWQEFDMLGLYNQLGMGG
jgi:predicted ester cyclase